MRRAIYRRYCVKLPPFRVEQVDGEEHTPHGEEPPEEWWRCDDDFDERREEDEFL